MSEKLNERLKEILRINEDQVKFEEQNKAGGGGEGGVETQEDRDEGRESSLVDKNFKE